VSCLKTWLTSKPKSNRKGLWKEKHQIEVPWDPVADFTRFLGLIQLGPSEFDQPDQALDL
jgi:hypothetical protein